MPNGVRWEGDLTANLENIDDRIKRGMVAAAAFTAKSAEAYMKANAPWTDRTSAARNGLRATTRTSGKKVAVILYHSVDYGIWLEVRWGGRYQIIRPAIQVSVPIFAEAIRRLCFEES